MSPAKYVISIVGAGGKTSLMFALAEEFKKEKKVLVTTTTKIYLPDESQYDYMAIGCDNFESMNNSTAEGIYIYGSSVNIENKILGLESDVLEKQLQHFDIVLIESDGAKQKLVKGWNSTEPVILNSTTHTIGVLNAKALGRSINSDNIHRIEEFMKITDSKEGEIINIRHLTSLVLNENGLFKNSKGEKILFVIGENDELIKNIVHCNNGYIDKIRCAE